MIIVFPYCHKDQDQAVRLADWLSEIGPFLDHDLLTVRDVRASVIPELARLFRSAKELVISDDVHNSWPQSPNLMFSKAAKYIEYGPKQPWLWLEPDAIPLRASVFHEIEAEYQRALEAGKFFLGDFVHLPEPGFKDHCSGVAVYPPQMTHHAGDAVMSLEIAWDVTASRQIVPKMFQSELILHRWKHPPFKSWEEVEQRIFAVRPKCALFHADKSGSIFPLLRERKNNLPVRRMMDLDASEMADDGPKANIEHAGEVKHDACDTSIRSDVDSASTRITYVQEQIPWASKPDSLAEIQKLADRLKQFCGHPSHVRAVRMILNDTGVITLPYRYKKRGKWRRKRKKKS